MKTLVSILISLFVSVVSANDIPKPIVDYAETNVWQVMDEDRGGSGSGFWLNETTFMTACHVVNGSELVYVTDVNLQYIVYLDVTACDEELDLALLKYTYPEPIEFNIKQTVIGDYPNRGKAVYSPGYPLGGTMLITYGHWQGGMHPLDPSFDSFVTLPTTFGDSGSPVLALIDGVVNIVGIRVRGRFITESNYRVYLPHIAIAVDPNIIRKFLDERLD